MTDPVAPEVPKMPDSMPPIVPLLTAREWIGLQDKRRLMKTLGVSRTTVEYWITGHTIPVPVLMWKLVRLSGGKISIDATYVAHFAASNKRRRRSLRRALPQNAR